MISMAVPNLVLEVELLLDGRRGRLGRGEDGNGVSGVGDVGCLAVADDQESVGTLTVVNEVADEQRLRVLGHHLARHRVEGQLLEISEHWSGWKESRELVETWTDLPS